MLSLPPPARDSSSSVSKDEERGGKPVISMAEDEDTLRHLLILCYPAFLPALDNMDELSLTIRVAQKFELPCASSIMKYRLLALASTAPERAYALGWIIQSKEVVHLAAKESLARPLLDISPQPEFAQIPESAVFELLAYHRLCLRSVSSIATSLEWLRPASLPAAVLQWQNVADADNTGRCNCNSGLVSVILAGGVELWIKTWCKTYLETAVGELQSCVRGSTVKQFKTLRNAVVNNVGNCTTCKANCYEALDKISDLLVEQVERVITKTSLKHLSELVARPISRPP
ncbi:hypothetical protein PENSPDRAFT_31330 [Peniophora sp. CONT]|nr:hypothetical protein PENSPDRAFT_31330 [Peniophora sp. CONT]